MSFDAGKYNYQFTKEKYDRISILFPKGTKQEIADKTGESVNSFVNRVVRDALDRFGLPEAPPSPAKAPDAPTAPEGYARRMERLKKQTEGETLEQVLARKRADAAQGGAAK